MAFITDVKEFKIVAKIFSLQKGFSSYENVKAIKIISKQYNLMIMEDYLPVIGEVEGTVIVMVGDDTIEYKNINGYYKHAHNEFELLIKEYGENAG